MKIKRFISIALAAICVSQLQPAGFAHQVSRREEMDSVYTMTYDTPSEYGYINYQLINENGDSVEDDFNADGESELLYTEAALPASYDSRDCGGVTGVRDQGLSANCWAFTGLGALEADYIAQGLGSSDNTDFSEAHLVWFVCNSATSDPDDPTYGDNVTISSPYTKAGNWIYNASALSKWSGTAKETDFPFYPSSLGSMGNYSESERYNTGGGAVLKSAETLTVMSKIKTWIMEHGAVTAGFHYASTYLNKSEGNTSYYCNDETVSINHDILIVGWDDNYAVTNFKSSARPQYPGAFLCKNSWGSDWGDGGYFWISYYDTALGNIIGYACASVDEYDNNYTYNGFAYGGAYKNTSENGSQVANVFTAKGYEKLAAVSTYTLHSNTSVTVSVYTDLPSDYSSPIEGTLAYTSNTTLANAGYHTIDLASEIPLTPGEIFSVVIKLYSSSGVVYVVGERSSGNTIYSSNARESYIDLSGTNSSWYDAQAYGLDNNCIQALTRCNHQLEPITITAATCTTTGQLMHCCSQCDYATPTISVSATGHSFGAWKTVLAATAASAGKEKRACENCDFIEERTIPKLSSAGHKVINIYDLLSMLRSWLNSFFETLKNKLY